MFLSFAVAQDMKALSMKFKTASLKYVNIIKAK